MDLRGREDSYLGRYDFNGKRVLEFGPANGGLTFWMEQQGAEVVALDLSLTSRGRHGTYYSYPRTMCRR